MREGQFTACATCALALLEIIWQNYCPGNPKGHIKPKLSWDMPEAIKTLYYDAHSPVDSLCNLCPPPPGYCNLQSKISTSVPANLPGAVNYDRKQGLCKQVSARCCYSVIYHRKCMFRRVHQPTHELQFAMESQDSGTCQPVKCWKLH